MYYQVYRQLGDKSWQKVASTKFLEDAQTIVQRFGVAYITSGGSIIFKKGFETSAYN